MKRALIVADRASVEACKTILEKKDIKVEYIGDKAYLIVTDDVYTPGRPIQEVSKLLKTFPIYA